MRTAGGNYCQHALRPGPEADSTVIPASLRNQPVVSSGATEQIPPDQCRAGSAVDTRKSMLATCLHFRYVSLVSADNHCGSAVAFP